jgi:glycosyltransferase involved in cell wall biosynthesis
MKIAMIGQKGIPAHFGGVERHVEELSIELAKHGHEVLVFCRSWYAPSSETYQGVRCIQTPSIRTKHLDAITHTFTSIIRAARENVDVFHIHGDGPALLSWLPRLLRPSARVIVTFHSIDRSHGKWSPFARLVLRLGEWMALKIPDATITVSKCLQTYARLQYELDTIYIPNGTRFHDELPDFNLIKNFNLTPNNYLLFCARLVQHKGAHTLIEAWKTLSKERPELVAGKKLAIVGGSAFTDAYVKKLHAMAKGDESIVMAGNQSGETLHALFAGSYAVVHPSTSEGLPISVLEAMSYGKCVLSTDIPENLELTEKHGLSFRADQTGDLVQHLAMLLEHPDLVTAVGKEARAHVAAEYDWADIGQKTVYLYEAMEYAPRLKVQTRRA